MRLNVVATVLMFGMPAFTYASNHVGLGEDEKLERYGTQVTSQVIGAELYPDAEPSLLARLGAFLYPVLSSLVNLGGAPQTAVEGEKSLVNPMGVGGPKISLQSVPIASSNDDEVFLPHTVMHYVIQHKDIITINDKRFQVHVDMIDFDTFRKTGELGMNDTAEWGSKVYLSRLYFKKIAKADDHIFFIGEGKTTEDTAHAYSCSYPGMRFFMALIAVDSPVHEPLLPVVSAYKTVTRKPEPFPISSLSWMEPPYKFKQKGAHLLSIHTPSTYIPYGMQSDIQQNVERRSAFPLFVPRLVEGPSPLPESSPRAGDLSPEYDRIIAEHEQKMKQMVLQERARRAVFQRLNQRENGPSRAVQKVELPSKSRMIRPSVELHKARGAEISLMDYMAITSKRLNLKTDQMGKKSRAPISGLRNVNANPMGVGPSKSRMIRPSVEFHKNRGAENAVMDFAVIAPKHLGVIAGFRMNERFMPKEILGGSLEDDV